MTENPTPRPAEDFEPVDGDQDQAAEPEAAPDTKEQAAENLGDDAGVDEDGN